MNTKKEKPVSHEDRGQFHRSGSLLCRKTLLRILKPIRLQHLELPNPWLRNVIAPLGNGARSDFEQLRQGSGRSGLLDCGFRFHVN